MPGNLRQSNNNIQRILNGRSRFRARNALEQRNRRDSAEDHHVNSLLWMSSEQRFVIFTVLTLENGTRLVHLVPILLPQGSSERKTDSEGTDSTHGAAAISFLANLQTDQGNSSTSSNSSSLVPYTSSDDQGRNMHKSSELVKRNKKKKNKKKKKKKNKNKKSSSNAKPFQLEVSCGGVHGGFSAKDPTTPKTVISYGEGVASERVTSVSDEFSSDDSIVSSTNGSETKEHVLSSFNEKVENISSNNEISSEAFSDAHNTPVTDSISDEWNSIYSTSASDDVEAQSFFKEDYVSSLSDTSEFTNYDFLLDGPGNNCFSTLIHLENNSDHDFGSTLPSEVGRQDRNLSSTYGLDRFSRGGKVRSYTGEENNFSVRQKVQNNDGGGCISDSTAAPMRSELSSASVEAPFSKRVSDVLASNDLVKTKYDGRPKLNVPENRKTQQSTGRRKQEYNNQLRNGTLHNKETLARAAKTMVEVTLESTRLNNQTGISTGVSQTSMIICCPPEPTPSCGETTKLDMEDSAVGYVNQDRSSGSVLQKWIPVARKDVSSEIDTSKSNLSSSFFDFPASKELALKEIDKDQSGAKSHSLFQLKDALVENIGLKSTVLNPPIHERHDLDGSVSKGIRLKDIDKKPLNPNSPSYIPLKYDVVTDLGLDSANLNSSPPRDETQVANLSCYTCTREQRVTGKCGNSSEFQISLNKIKEAVTESYRTDMVSRSVEQATGSPLAQFETLLYSSSPALGGNIQDGRSCLRSHFIDSPLARNEIPDITLTNFWIWYDEIGTCGLKVKVEDQLMASRSGVECVSAYYVPYLSAIQLFGNPQPRSKTTAFGEEDFSLRTAPIDDPDLLFEYFEFEQPFQRPPLFDKIKELAQGNGFHNCKTYGNPKLLESMNLRDLHPGSWYSVAWYPIYRIPEGNLRAAFLTYHSLGHFTVRQALSASPGGDIVSPVVGLQSYNAEAECWFQLKPSPDTLKEETLKYNRAEILKDRLKSLENTASVMARAVVFNGKAKERNLQNDYEFFLARKRL